MIYTSPEDEGRGNTRHPPLNIHYGTPQRAAMHVMPSVLCRLVRVARPGLHRPGRTFVSGRPEPGRTAPRAAAVTAESSGHPRV